MPEIQPVPQRLARMQGGLGVEERTVAASMWTALARACTACGARTRCTRWLLFGGTVEEYRASCPNAARYGGLLCAGSAQGLPATALPLSDDRILAAEPGSRSWTARRLRLLGSGLAALIWAYWAA